MPAMFNDDRTVYVVNVTMTIKSVAGKPPLCMNAAFDHCPTAGDIIEALCTWYPGMNCDDGRFIMGAMLLGHDADAVKAKLDTAEADEAGQSISHVTSSGERITISRGPLL